ncbi:MAG TPA: o-succinylbenzoate--CoA ligase [Ktedonobacter sp.]|nr:o-succinylbenzoate--CoA ligase [Ktedonobacter sp.]
MTILLPDWLTRCAENRPAHIALSDGMTRWSFAELNARVTQWARRLATVGVEEGSHVALLAGNSLDFVVIVHALMRLRAVLVPLNTRLTHDELLWQIRDVEATLLLCDAEHMPRAIAIAQQVQDVQVATFEPSVQDSRDEAEHHVILLSEVEESETCTLHTLIDLDATQAIMYTSGTTGMPKGAIITYGMQWWSATSSALNLGHDPDDCWLACLSFFHIGGLTMLMKGVIYGISVYVQPRFDAYAVNEAILHERVTIISVVSVMLQRMLADLDARKASYPDTMRCVLLGGGPAPQPLLEACASRNIPVVQTYGMTEACSQAVTLAPDDALRKLGSAGRPLAAVQLRVMNEDSIAQAGEAGEIQLQGPTITPGYYKRPDATQRAFHDGWFATGDIGYLDAEGYLYMLDRRSDLIISGGENVYPAEIEAVLLAHPAVQEAGVTGRADLQWGQVPVAFVHLYEGQSVSEHELMEFVAGRLAKYKRPSRIYIVGALPRNSSGKLLRRELMKLL